jgi:hypothetical protein
MAVWHGNETIARSEAGEHITKADADNEDLPVRILLCILPGAATSQAKTNESCPKDRHACGLRRMSIYGDDEIGNGATVVINIVKVSDTVGPYSDFVDGGGHYCPEFSERTA